MPIRRAWLTGFFVTAAYVGAARIGFELAFVAEQVTTVWAPTGIAVAALLLGGRRLWPAVYAGAFIANAGTNAPLWTAALIAGGNTLEAVAAATLLPRRWFDPGLSRLNDALRFIGLAALAATAISATAGVATLCAAGLQPWGRFAAVWWQWWLGDALGALVIAPLVLTVVRPVRTRTRQDWIAAVALMAAAVTVTQVVFSEALGPIFGRGPLHYVLFPLVIIAAVRFGQPASALTVVGASLVAILNTANAAGPFATDNIEEGLVLLQVFMGVLAATGLLLAAAIVERDVAQRRLRAAHAVGEVLADAPDLESAAPAILRGISEGLGWQFGAMWVADEDGARLRCFAVWSDVTSPAADSFMVATRHTQLEPGIGLPGRVWAGGRSEWIEDVGHDGNIPHADAARRAGMHGGFAVPVRLGGDVLGVIEFFTHRVSARNPDLLDAMSTIGSQVGQFIGRKRVEASIRLSEEQLRDAARRKDEFLAVLAHELRNPLAPIRTGLELVRLAGDDPREVQRVRTMMERQIRHMVRLIDDLLDVSRITSGKIHLQRQPAALTEIVDTAAEANRAAIEAAAVRLELDLPVHPVTVWVDPTRLVQVLSNLLHNAVKFSHHGGGVEIRARIQPDAVGADQLVLTVTDHGVGIPGELLPRVFDLFTQGDRPGNGGTTGLGIGLALARRIVEMHGGRLEARSDGPGRGAEFSIVLPSVQVGTAVAVPADRGAPARADNKRVLVIDDNVDAADMLAVLVRTMGAESRTAHDGAAGVRMACEFRPDVVLLDIGMPGLDGYETCRRLRASLDRSTLIVAVTGWGQERDKARAAEAGFDAHFTKPVDPAAIEQLLDARPVELPDSNRRTPLAEAP